MARRPSSPLPQSPVLTPGAKRNAIDRITRRIDELRSFDPLSVTMRQSPEVAKLEADIEQTLSAIFGSQTDRYNRYAQAADLEPPFVPVLQVPDWITVRGSGDAHRGENIDELRKQINERRHRAIVLLQSAAQGLEEELEEGNAPKPSELASSSNARQPKVSSRKVFIVHGHDEVAKLSVAGFLKSTGFEPIILHEQTNRGRTIIEKFEAHSDAGFAVVLLTPDDRGAAADQTEYQHRARQNVIMEWGYFIARLGRSKVVALRKDNVELPSDMDGIVWEPFDQHGAWKGKLAKELEDAGFDIDWKKVGRS
jgi:predicted nucleotide-binding protein